MVPSLERHRDKDIRTGGTADAAANWGAGGEGGEFTILRTRVLVSKSKERDQSDPHVAELSTQQKKQNMLEKYVEHISKKNKLRIGSNIFRNIFFHHKLTQGFAHQYKRYIQQFRRKKEKRAFAVSTDLMYFFLKNF